MRFLRRHGAFLLVLVAAALLRLPGIGWFPSPAGDEGNWALYGLRLSRGQTAELAPDAAFVSLLFARLIAASIGVLGPTFVAARAVNAIGVMLGMAGTYAGLASLGARRAGVAAAAVVAVHPWAVFYARTASVPYALALAAMTAGPTLFAAGGLRHRPSLVATGIVITSVAIHFSPLAAVGIVACAFFSLFPAVRWILGSPATWVAAAVAAAQGLPVVAGALQVARRSPELPQLAGFPAHLWGYVHMMGTGLMGEATVRHFTNVALSPPRAAVLLVPLAMLVVLGARAPRAHVLGGFATLYLAVGAMVAPLLLAPGRNWYLPANHMDRYLFALLPGFALLVGEIAERGRRPDRLVVAALLAWLAVGTTGRIGWALLRGGGVDHGEGVFDGGSGYRGWLVSDRQEPTAFQVRETVLAEGGGHGAVLVADRTFIPLAYAMDGSGVPVHDVRRTTIPPNRDGLFFVLLWPDRVLSIGEPPTAPPKYVASNRALRERMERLFRRRRLVRVLRQRDGSPLLEIWRAEDPAPRLRMERMPEPDEPGE